MARARCNLWLSLFGVGKFMARKPMSDLEETRRLMRSLVRMKPKPHEDMKVGETRKISKKPKQKSNKKI
jgi:hypothetical protein